MSCSKAEDTDEESLAREAVDACQTWCRSRVSCSFPRVASYDQNGSRNLKGGTMSRGLCTHYPLVYYPPSMQRVLHVRSEKDSSKKSAGWLTRRCMAPSSITLPMRVGRGYYRLKELEAGRGLGYRNSVGLGTMQSLVVLH